MTNMTCPVCGEKTTVVESVADIECVYRKRRCLECGHTFTTTEQESNVINILKSLRYERKIHVKNRKN